jgi:recombination protein RecR
MNTYPSKYLEDAVTELIKLPGIGKRTALRLALWMLKQDISNIELLGNAIIHLRQKIQYCTICHNISDEDVCNICADNRRNASILCIVEDVRDVVAIENTKQFDGVYHVLGGVISPMEGIGPANLNIESLIRKTADNEIKEVIIALPSTTEGDTTAFYLYRKIKENVNVISTISRGISVGDDLEYADEVTLGKSIRNRIPFDKSGI